MNIIWLWHYTNSSNLESSRISNEENAFVAYARWRAMTRWVRRLFARTHQHLQRRSTHRKLMSLPDYLLTDIGMYRSGDEIRVEEVHRSRLASSAALSSGVKRERGARYVSCSALCVCRTGSASRVSADDTFKAA